MSLLMDRALTREDEYLEQMMWPDGYRPGPRKDENQMRAFLYITATWSITLLIVYLLLGPGHGLPSYAVFVS